MIKNNDSFIKYFLFLSIIYTSSYYINRFDIYMYFLNLKRIIIFLTIFYLLDIKVLIVVIINNSILKLIKNILPLIIIYILFL